MRHSISLRILGASANVFFVAAAFSPLPSVLSGWMSAVGRPEPAAAIVVLGGGGVRPDGSLTDVSLRRTLHGINLYRQGLAPLIVFSGSTSATGHDEAQIRATLARECIRQPVDILTESASRTTREEALNISSLLHPRGIRRIVLVADAEGMRRAAGAFEKVGFEVTSAPTADVPGHAETPESRLVLTRLVLIESVAWLYYRIAGYL